MTSDDRVGRALTAMAADLRPAPDPYGRALARYRRNRRRRRVAIAACLSVIVAFGGVAAVRLADAPGRDRVTEADPDSPFNTYNRWARRLAESKPQGSVGSDAQFVSEFSRLVADHVRAGRYRDDPRSVREVRVPFVGDVGEHRIALVAFILNAPDSRRWPHAQAWFVAPRGATAAELASPSDDIQFGDGLDPMVRLSLDRVDVAVAPAGCAFASAPLPAATDWQAEPTGSTLIRTAQTRRAEWWRVTCDGVVRAQLPAGQPVATGPLLETQLDAALARTRGVVNRELSRRRLSQSQSLTALGAQRMPDVVWNGRLAGSPAEAGGGAAVAAGSAVLLAAPLVGGGWAGELGIALDTATPGGETELMNTFSLPEDPGDPTIMVVAPLAETTALLVVAPAGAVRVRAVRSGSEVARAEVVDGAAVLRPDTPDGLTVEALDAAGSVLTRGEPASPKVRGGSFDTWDESD